MSRVSHCRPWRPSHTTRRPTTRTTLTLFQLQSTRSCKTQPSCFCRCHSKQWLRISRRFSASVYVYVIQSGHEHRTQYRENTCRTAVSHLYRNAVHEVKAITQLLLWFILSCSLSDIFTQIHLSCVWLHVLRVRHLPRTRSRKPFDSYWLLISVVHIIIIIITGSSRISSDGDARRLITTTSKLVKLTWAERWTLTELHVLFGYRWL